MTPTTGKGEAGRVISLEWLPGFTHLEGEEGLAQSERLSLSQGRLRAPKVVASDMINKRGAPVRETCCRMPLLSPVTLLERRYRKSLVTFLRVVARHNPRGEALKEQGGVGARKAQDVTAGERLEVARGGDRGSRSPIRGHGDPTLPGGPLSRHGTLVLLGVVSFV